MCALHLCGPVWADTVCCVLAEIISKVKEPPPLCRPVLSVDEAPVDVIQVMKQCWSEEPEKRPTFEEIFKQVETLENAFASLYMLKGRAEVWHFHFLPFPGTVQEHHKRQKDQHHRLDVAHAGAVLVQPGGFDPREDGGVGGGETEDRQTAGCYVAQVSAQQPSVTQRRRDSGVKPLSLWGAVSMITVESISKEGQGS